MPVGFWNDPEGRKYRAAYFERFPAVCITGLRGHPEHDGLVIYGRSDAVLNPGGVRIGYAGSMPLSKVWRKCSKPSRWDRRQNDCGWCVCTLEDWFLARRAPGGKRFATPSARTTPRHVPAKVVAVADSADLIGQDHRTRCAQCDSRFRWKTVDALANPQALEHFRDLPV